MSETAIGEYGLVAVQGIGPNDFHLRRQRALKTLFTTGLWPAGTIGIGAESMVLITA